MMSKQSGDADGPRQQMTGGISQQDTAELSGVETASLNSIRSGTFNQCSCVWSGTIRPYLDAEYTDRTEEFIID